MQIRSSLPRHRKNCGRFVGPPLLLYGTTFAAYANYSHQPAFNAGATAAVANGFPNFSLSTREGLRNITESAVIGSHYTIPYSKFAARTRRHGIARRSFSRGLSRSHTVHTSEMSSTERELVHDDEKEQEEVAEDDVG